MQDKGSVARRQMMKQGGTGKVPRVELQRQAYIPIAGQKAKIEVPCLDCQQTGIGSWACRRLVYKIDMVYAFHIPSIVYP